MDKKNTNMKTIVARFIILMIVFLFIFIPLGQLFSQIKELKDTNFTLIFGMLFILTAIIYWTVMAIIIRRGKQK